MLALVYSIVMLKKYISNRSLKVLDATIKTVKGVILGKPQKIELIESDIQLMQGFLQD